ncbi:MAG: hypothetical protein DYH18_09065 [Xanthomonadales bacterium PRO7]|nr:hypothetical protein [Xanthomonadales bacterium PRO7]
MLAFALLPAAANAATISSGYSGNWYNPARSGEGLQLEILSPEFALVEWYTYDSQGKQRWIQGVGNIAGDSIQFPQVYTTQGGKFGPAFNPDDVKINVVGNLSLTFGDCNTGTFKYTAFGQSQTLPIQRLTQTMGAGCAPINGVPGEPVQSYAGQSGSWYNPARSGEGFDLQWLANGAAVVTWYTYDANGNQVWLLGVGSQQNGTIVFDQMAISKGPKFGAAYNKADLQQDDWGSLTLTLDCNGGTAHYASKQTAFGSGDLTLTRLTHLQQPACPYVQPKFSDLYSVTWEEIPIAQGTPANPNIISAESIANDGTIAGRRGGHLVLWHPDTQIWEDVPRDLAAVPVFISSDGSKVIATDDSPADESLPVHTLLWQRPTGWQALPGDVIFDSVTLSVSRNFQFAAGYGHNKGETDQAWIRAVDGMQQILPMPEPNTIGNPLAISNDGNTVIGMALRFTTPSGWPTPVAVRWQTNGQPTILHNPAGEELAVANVCNADCSIIFGNHLYNYDPSQAHSGEAWYLMGDGAFNYLGSVADEWSTPGYGVTDATADGAFAIGSYVTKPPIAGYPAATVNRAFIWTQTTGIVSVRSLVNELGIGDDDWDWMTTIRLSPDGDKILLGGLHRLDLYPTGYSRAAVLHLIPKSSTN